MGGSSSDALAGGAAALLELVRTVAAEAQPHRPPPPVSLDSSLERDLGLDSLGRAELLLRVEAELGTALPARVLGEAETPRDLLRALASASPRRGDDGGAATVALAEPLAGTVAEARPERAATLLDVLRWHADRHAERLHVRLLDEERGEIALSYGALLRDASRIAISLAAGGLAPGERVALMLATGL